MPAVLRRLNLSVIVRVIADVCLVSFGLLAGLIARSIGLIQFGASWGVRPDGVLSTGEVWRYYFLAAPTLTFIAILTFTFSGFYTRGRYYTSHYKAIVVAQAVTLTYLIFGFANAFVTPGSPHPRSSLVVAWFVTLVAVMIARLWSAIWRTLVRLEQSPNVQRTGRGPSRPRHRRCRLHRIGPLPAAAGARVLRSGARRPPLRWRRDSRHSGGSAVRVRAGRLAGRAVSGRGDARRRCGGAPRRNRRRSGHVDRFRGHA